VGRSGQQAYAYLLYDPARRLTETAEKRLRSIFEATDLGAGFRIAMKDLEIRGAGNLLGPEQSGFMNTVGFDLYCRLVAEAVEELRGKRTIPATDLVIDLPLGAHLPDSYVGDGDVKVRLYRRLATLETEAEVRQPGWSSRTGLASCRHRLRISSSCCGSRPWRGRGSCGRSRPRMEW